MIVEGELIYQEKQANCITLFLTFILQSQKLK